MAGVVPFELLQKLSLLVDFIKNLNLEVGESQSVDISKMFFIELCVNVKNKAGMHDSGSQHQAYLLLPLKQVTNTIFKKAI